MFEEGIDVSKWQGTIDFSLVPQKLVSIKMSGGDDGLYLDSKAFENYANAKAAHKYISMYHFAGGTDPIAEAEFFIKACSPLEINDVLILDWEVQHDNPVAWCKTFIQTVIDKTGVIPIIYMNTSTTRSYDWSSVVNMGVALWVADYTHSPLEKCPIGSWSTYIGHQYTSRGKVAGINGDVDLDAWFITLDQFNKYGYQQNKIQDIIPMNPSTNQPMHETIPKSEYDKVYAIAELRLEQINTLQNEKDIISAQLIECESRSTIIVDKINIFIGSLFSRKLILALATAIPLFKMGKYNEAIGIIVSYLAANTVEGLARKK